MIQHQTVEIENAKDLFDFLESLKSQGIDLASVKILKYGPDIEGWEVTEVMLDQHFEERNPELVFF